MARIINDLGEGVTATHCGDCRFCSGAWCLEFCWLGPLPTERGARLRHPVCIDADAGPVLEALRLARIAIGEHNPPGDCYATGPNTGLIIPDLVSCPACAAILKIDAALAKLEGK